MVNWLIILILTQTFTDLLMTKRLQTLQSVDVAMERIVQALADTFIFYTSDHGESREERTSLTSGPAASWTNPSSTLTWRQPSSTLPG